MKPFLALFLSILSVPVFGQKSAVRHIEYDISIDDPDSIFSRPDQPWHFVVDYDERYVRLNIQKGNAGQIRIIDKKEGIVLYFIRNSFEDSTVRCTTLQEMSLNDMYDTEGSETRDTVFMKYHKSQNILGFECSLKEMKFEKPAYQQVWVSDKLSCGVIIPETPLCLKNIALEYVMQSEFGKVTYKATTVSELDATVLSMDILEGYDLVVPSYVFEPNNPENTPNEKEVSQLIYPKYLKSEFDLGKDFLLYHGWDLKQVEKMDSDYAEVQFEIDDKGKIRNIEFNEDFEKIKTTNKRKILEFLETCEFSSGSIYGIPVDSHVYYAFHIPSK